MEKQQIKSLNRELPTKSDELDVMIAELFDREVFSCTDYTPPRVPCNICSVRG